MKNKSSYNALIDIFTAFLPVIIFGQYFLVEFINQAIWATTNSSDLTLNFIEKTNTVVLLTNCSAMLGILGGIVYIVYIIKSLITAIITYKRNHPNDKKTLSIFCLLYAFLGNKTMRYLGPEDTDKYKIRNKLLTSTLSLVIAIPLLVLFLYITLNKVPFSNIPSINQSLSNYKNHIFTQSEVYIVTSTDSYIAELLDDDQFINAYLEYKEIVAIDSYTNETIKLSMPIEIEFKPTGTIFSPDINYHLERNNNNLQEAKESVAYAIENNKNISKTLYKVSYVEGLNVVVNIEPIK